MQIYEIQTPYEAEKCIELGVDRVGGVVANSEEWRLPQLREVARLCESSGVKSSIIPLFSKKDLVLKVLEYYRPQVVHFCENLTDPSGGKTDFGPLVRLQEELKRDFPETIIMRTIPIPAGELREFPFLEIARDFEPVSDLFLIDAFVVNEPVEGYIGITGKRANRKMAEELVLRSGIPVVLAGGLSPENVYDAVVEVLPAGADSCTLTNARDGSGNPIRFKKDFRKVEKFVAEIRRAEKAIETEEKRRREKLGKLREELQEREAALPAHSVSPHQIQAVEALEEEIEGIENRLRVLEMNSLQAGGPSGSASEPRRKR